MLIAPLILLVLLLILIPARNKGEKIIKVCIMAAILLIFGFIAFYEPSWERW